MAETPISKSQARLARLLGLETDETYGHTARLLAAAGWPSDGVPAGHTWRSAAKLSDAELLATPPATDEQVAFRSASRPVTVATTAEVKRESELRNREIRQSIRDAYNRPYASRDSEDGREYDGPYHHDQLHDPLPD